MIYIYYCYKCDKTVEVEKSMNDASRKEYCECGQEVGRVYKVASIKTNDGVK